MDISTIPKPKPFKKPAPIVPPPINVVNLSEDTIEVRMSDDSTVYKWEPESTIPVEPIHWGTSHALERLRHGRILAAITDPDKKPVFRTRRFLQWSCDSWQQCDRTDCPLNIEEFRFPRPKTEEDLNDFAKRCLEHCKSVRKSEPKVVRLADRSEKEDRERDMKFFETARRNEVTRLTESIERAPWFVRWYWKDGNKLAIECNDVMEVHPAILQSIKGNLPALERYLAERESKG